MEESGRSDESSAEINVGPLLSSLQVELSNSPLSMSPNVSIFKIPNILFRHSKHSFHPNCFSIGPMHHDKKHLAAAEEIKIKYLKGMLSRVIESTSPRITMSEEAWKIEEQKILTDCIAAVMLIAKKASGYYAGHDYAEELGDEFVRILLLDACFIIELFRKYARVITRDDDPIFSMSCMLEFLGHDLILLENQIPWLVLETLFEKTKLPYETRPLTRLAIYFFYTLFSRDPPRVQDGLFAGQKIKHILDLLRLSLVLPSEECKNNKRFEWKAIPPVTRLKEAGVKFVKFEKAKSILDIKFIDGSLLIPSLLIQETTETIFRNLIAYEQCLPHCPPVLTFYAKVLDGLINTANDVDILCKNDILANWMSDEEASQFFNKLYNDTCVKEFYYFQLCADLNSYCRRWWPRWRASYVHNYFSKPWAIAAQIYAVVILALTLWQTCIKKD